MYFPTRPIRARRRRSILKTILLGIAIAIPCLAAFALLLVGLALFTPLHAAPNTTSNTIQVSDLERHYLLHLPPRNATNSGTPLPLILVLHGATQRPESAERMTGLSDLADRHNFIVVYPSGTSRAGFAPTWNAGNCCGYAAKNNVNDLAFLRALIDKLERDHPSGFRVDPTRVFVTGISNGGMMSYRLACEDSDQIAAIAPVEGAQNLDCHPARPVSLIIFHGTADRLVPFDGGSPRFQFGPHRTDASVPTTLAFWAAQDACSAPPATSDTPELHTTIYSGCKSGTGVELDTIPGGHHMWPGHVLSGNHVPASDLIYSFFISHPKP